MPENESEEKRLLSRRSLLRGGAIAGAVGVGVAMAGGAGTIGAALKSAPRPASRLLANTTATGSGPIVIYLADPRTGEMDIFAGTGQTHHTNHSMAAMVASMAPRV